MQFALSVGIATNSRLERTDWKDDPESGEGPSPGTQFATYTGAKGIAYLLDSLDQIGNKTVVSNVEEILNGGLEYLKKIEFENGKDQSWNAFYSDFKHLDPDEEE